MPLHQINSEALHLACRQRLDTLELWLKRIVHDELSDAFGDYLNARRNGIPVLRGNIQRWVNSRRAERPDLGKHRRPVDDMTLEQLIGLICHGTYFHTCFTQPFQLCFGLKREQLEVILDRLRRARNRLSHTQRISVHDAQRVLCYGDDIILSLKHYYKKKGKESDMNRPVFTRFWDSLGHDMHITSSKREWNYTNDLALRPGDPLHLHVEVDTSFNPDTYDINWTIGHRMTKIGTGHDCHLVLTPAHVNMMCSIQATLIARTDQGHRHGDYDDFVRILCKVCPADN